MEVMNGLVGEEFLPPGAAPTVPGDAPQREPPEHVWLVIHAADYDMLSKDLPHFRHIVTRSISTALGVPIGCVEMLDLSAGARGGAVAALALCGGRGRGAGELRRELGQQLRSTSSALRRGHLAEYLTSAEMLLSSPSPSPRDAEDGPGAAQEVAYTYAIDRGVEARDHSTTLVEVVALMRREQARLEAAEAAHQSALSELQARGEVVAKLQEELAARKGLREEQDAEERRLEEERLREEQAAQERLLEEQAAQAEQAALVGAAEAFVQAVALGSMEELVQEGLGDGEGPWAGAAPMSARPVQAMPHPDDTPRSDVGPAP